MKSMRADFAAAAATPTTEEEAPATDPRAAARIQLARAETVLAGFRATIRADLRTHIARGGSLDPALVDALTQDLEGVTARVRASLG
ncbi:MAG TPA: PadR family transcriptional regulator, partial [Microbacterium sp.]|nr:PadR family transcriptional regulator [Microbacterium sp.]